MITPRLLMMEGSEILLPWAKSKFRALEAQARAFGGQASSRGIHPEFSIMYLIEVDLLSNNGSITMGSPGVEVLSGLVDNGLIIDIEVEEGGETVTKPAVQRFEPGAIQDEIDGKGRAWKNERKIAVEASVPNRRTSSDVHTYAQTSEVSSAMFTGAMRYAVQIAMGRKDCVIEYQHTHQCSHGVFMHDGVAWLIEISTNHGVLAKKMTGDKRARPKLLDTALKTKFPIIPDGKAFGSTDQLQDDIANGVTRVLLTHEEMGDAYSWGVATADTSWAFDENGSNAVVVGFQRPGEWVRGAMWRVSISADETGPISASVTNDEEGWLWDQDTLDDASNSHLYFPAGDGTNKVQTYDLTRAHPFQVQPTEEGWETPVYAFYVGSDLQVWRQKMHRGFVSALEEEDNGIDPTSSAAPHVSSLSSPIGHTPIGPAGTYEWNAARAAQDHIYFTGPGCGTKVHKEAREYVRNTLAYESAGGAALTGYAASFGVAGEYAIATGLAHSVVDMETGFSDQEYSGESLTISPRSRTAVFVARSETRMEGTRSYSGSINCGLVVPPGGSYTLFHDAPGAEGYVADGSGSSSPNGALVVSYSTGDISPANFGGYPLNWRGASGTITVGATVVSAGVSDFSGGQPASEEPHPVPDNLSLWRCVNGPWTADTIVDLDDATEVARYLKAFNPSPNPETDYMYAVSGVSAYLNTLYSSRLPDGLSGSELVISAGGGADLSELSGRTGGIGLS